MGEERQKRQDYDLKELKERQRQQNKQKAIKLGLDPEALTGKYPPKIRMYSKYERRTDTRTYDDRRKLYEGGWDVLCAELLEKTWKRRNRFIELKSVKFNAFQPAPFSHKAKIPL